MARPARPASRSEIELAPVSTRCTIGSVELDGPTLKAEISGEHQAPQAWALAVLRVDGDSQWIDLSSPEISGQVSASWTGDTVVEGLRLFAFENGCWHQVPERVHPGVLTRLLCRNSEEINLNIRWHGRIEHFQTRVFAALNSFRHLQSDVNTACYCLASIGYTAIERQNEVVARQVFGALEEMFRSRLSDFKGEPRHSFLTHLAHHALHFRRPVLFEQVVGAARASLDEIPQAPVAAFNAIVVMMLAGMYYYELGWKPRAAEYFDQGDRLFRIAAAGYPRDLVKYRELTTIGQRAYWSQIGAQASRGVGLRPELGIKMFGCEWVASEVSRLTGKEPRERFGRSLLALVAARREQLSAARVEANSRPQD